MKSRFFRILLGIDLLIGLIAAVSFVAGLLDGSVSSFNLEIWIAIWLGLAAIISSGVGLKTKGYPKLGIVLLLVLAVPGLICAFVLIITLVTGARWI